jgi:hypothetical protein
VLASDQDQCAGLRSGPVCWPQIRTSVLASDQDQVCSPQITSDGVLYSCLVSAFRLCEAFSFAQRAYTDSGSQQRETGAFAEGMNQDRRSANLVRPAYSSRIRDIPVVAGDADRDRERRSSMVRARMVAFRRLAIGRSAVGVPRTYRIVRTLPWGRRLVVLLRRLMP